MSWRSIRRGTEIVLIAAFGVVVGVLIVSTVHRYSREPAGMGAEREIPSPTLDRSRVRIEVRNGSGAPGAAGSMTEFLRENGFDVVDFGNADRFDYTNTIVIDRIGDPAAAREVAAVVGVDTFASRIDSTLYVDVSVVVGRGLETPVGDPSRP